MIHIIFMLFSESIVMLEETAPSRIEMFHHPGKMEEGLEVVGLFFPLICLLSVSVRGEITKTSLQL